MSWVATASGKYAFAGGTIPVEACGITPTVFGLSMQESSASNGSLSGLGFVDDALSRQTQMALVGVRMRKPKWIGGVESKTGGAGGSLAAQARFWERGS